jgi:tetratricopeptide (TPR) repeat protein
MLAIKKWARPARPTTSARWWPAALALLFVVGCDPPGRKALLTGERLMQQGKPAAAVEPLKQATALLATNPAASALAWNELGLAYHRAGRLAEATQAYQTALKRDFNLVAARYNLGCALLAQSNLAGAINEFTTYATHRPRDTAGWLRLGATQYRARQHEAAERSLQKALELNLAAGERVEVLNLLGMSQAMRRRPQDAFRSFQAAMRLHTNYAPALLNQAIVAQVQLNDRKLAVQKYRAYLDATGATNQPAVSNLLATLETDLRPRPTATNQTPAVTNLLARHTPTPTNPPAVLPPPSAKSDLTTTLVPPPKPPPAANATNLPRRPVLVASADTPKPPSASTITNLASPPAPTPSTNPPPAPREPPPPSEPPTKPAIATTSTSTPTPAPTPAPSAAAAAGATATATNAPAPPAPQPIEVVHLTNEPQVKPAQDAPRPPTTRPAPILAPPPPVRPAESGAPPKPATAGPTVALPATNPPPAVAERPQTTTPPPQASVEDTAPVPPPKRSLVQRLNPLNLLRSKSKPTPEPAPRRASATPATASAPSTGAVVVAAAAPVPARTFPHYAYAAPAAVPAGDRAAAERYFLAGLEAQKAGSTLQAIRAYQAAVAADPTYFDACYNLGVAAQDAAAWPVALRAYEEALALKPADPNARFNFALALTKAGYPVDAANELEVLLGRTPANAEAHLMAANLYDQTLGERAKARAHYTKVLELNPSHPQAGAIRRWLAVNR